MDLSEVEKVELRNAEYDLKRCILRISLDDGVKVNYAKFEGALRKV